MKRPEIFPPRVIDAIQDAVQARVVSAGDLMQRKHPILPEHRVAMPDELAQAVIGCIHTLPDDLKRELIRALERTISK